MRIAFESGIERDVTFLEKLEKKRKLIKIKKK